MAIYENLSKEELADLLKAYDCYISTAADAGRLQTGWVPVCVAEFYSCEYQDVWLAGQNFDYMYDYEEVEMGTINSCLAAFNNVQIFSANGTLMCQFDGEDQKRFIRSRIEDIRDGDAFFIGTGLHYADGAAQQNMYEPDNPWFVFDAGGDGWFREDIGDPIACLEAIMLSQQSRASSKPGLDHIIQTAEKTASQSAADPKETRQSHSR